MQLDIVSVTNRDTWNDSLARLMYAHVLQTWEWGEFKSQTTGWVPDRIAFGLHGETVAMAQVLTRQQGPFKIMYIPKGPVLDYTNGSLRQAVLDMLLRHARESGAIFLKIDPDVVVGVGIPGQPDAYNDPLGSQIIEEWKQTGLAFSKDQIQFRNSVILDLRPTEEEIIAGMKQKTRYNVRLGYKRDLDIRLGTFEDLDTLYALYRETALRDNFIIRPLEYYRKAWADFMRAGLAQPIIAEYRGHAIAHVIIFGFGKRAWYFYGASSDDERNRMPTYALQWEAIRWAKSQKMLVYDFWGAPDDFYNETDPLAGVFRFKEGFGGTVVRRIGAWDYAANHLLYQAYTRAMPAVLAAMKLGGQRRLRQESG